MLRSSDDGAMTLGGMLHDLERGSLRWNVQWCHFGQIGSDRSSRHRPTTHPRHARRAIGGLEINGKD
jgi:hypothetical protein